MEIKAFQIVFALPHGTITVECEINSCVMFRYMAFDEMTYHNAPLEYRNKFSRREIGYALRYAQTDVTEENIDAIAKAAQSVRDQSRAVVSTAERAAREDHWVRVMYGDRV